MDQSIITFLESIDNCVVEKRVRLLIRDQSRARMAQRPAQDGFCIRNLHQCKYRPSSVSPSHSKPSLRSISSLMAFLIWLESGRKKTSPSEVVTTGTNFAPRTLVTN